MLIAKKSDDESETSEQRTANATSRAEAEAERIRFEDEKSFGEFYFSKTGGTKSAVQLLFPFV